MDDSNIIIGTDEARQRPLEPVRRLTDDQISGARPVSAGAAFRTA